MLKMTAREPRKVYLERFVFMAALSVLSVFMQGFRVIPVCLVSIVACMVTDFVCCKIRRMKYDIHDTAVPFWGMCAAMMMPASMPVLTILLSSVICIVVGKHFFGASDNIVFSPPAISTAFMIICYPGDMLYFPNYGDKYPVFADFTGTLVRSGEYTLKFGNVPTGTVPDVLIGTVPGAIGTVYVLVILVCLVCMILRRSNSLCSAVSCLIAVGLLAFFFPRADYSGLQSVFCELTSGYLLFGITFLAAEPYRMPQTVVGRILYGAVLGYITMMFRYFGQTEGSFIFALLIVGALCSGFDRLVDNLMYFKKAYVNSFERSKDRVQTGKVRLTDTQEIVLPEKYRYNTPPIDGKIKRHRKRSASDSTDERKEDENDGQQ